MKLGIFLPNWLGDLVMATPALRAIRRHFGPETQTSWCGSCTAAPANSGWQCNCHPNNACNCHPNIGAKTHIVGILRPKLAELLAGADWLDEQWLFDPRAAQSDLRRLALVRRMRRERFDVVLLLTNSLHTALLAWLGGARERIGYVRYGRGGLLTGKLYPRRLGRDILPAPVVDSYLALAEAIGCPPEPPRLELATTQAEEQLGERIWRSLGLRSDGRVIAINNSGAYGSAKRWPSEHAGGLARRIAAELDHDVLVVCGPGEEPAAQEIVACAQHPRVFSLAGQPLGLAATKTCLRRSRLTVSTDSGPRHVAAAFGRPVVTLLGPTLPIWIENPTVRGELVRLKLDCTGCGKRVCPLGHHRCMKELTPDRVIDAVARSLQSVSSQ